MPESVAKILEVGPYPPPLAGWSIRIKFVLDHLQETGHDCQALNIGKSRKVPSDEYIAVNGLFDYVWKTGKYAARGYTMHMHANGDGPIGIALALICAAWGCLFFRRVVMSFHAGIEQDHFPRERSGWMFPFIYLLFKLPKMVLCDNEAVREKIIEYGMSPDKVKAIQTFGSDYVKGDDVPLPERVETYIQKCDPVIYTYFFMREGFHLEAFVSGVRRLADRYPNIGVINAGSVDEYEPPVRERILKQIEDENVGDHVFFADDLTHDEFLTLARRSKLYLRTPTSDGECASVLEALTLGLPVVASENHTRPESVITYQHDDPDDLYQKVADVLENYDDACDKVIPPAVHDTIAEEGDALILVNLGAKRAAPVLAARHAAAQSTASSEESTADNSVPLKS